MRFSLVIARIAYGALALSVSLVACSGASGGPVPPAPTASATPLSTPTSTPTPVPTAGSYAVRETDEISYGTSPDETLDAFVPNDGRTSRAAVIVVHGGASVAGDKRSLVAVSSQIAAAGFSVFDIDYTLATMTVPGYPTQGNQVQAAIAWVRANAATYGVDPTRIGALGSSHGGELVALVALEGSGAQTSGVRLAAAVLWSGPTDLVTLYQSACPPTGPSCSSQPEVEYLDCLYPDCPAQYVAASPVTYVDASDPPMEIFNSTNELVPLSQADELAADLAKVGIAHQEIVYPGTQHADAYSAQALPATISFFFAQLSR